MNGFFFCHELNAKEWLAALIWAEERRVVW